MLGITLNKKQKKIFGIVFVVASIGLFLVLKLSDLSFHFGDGNVYPYMAKSFLSGDIPYLDFFLADPPFLLLFLIPFVLLFGKHIILFQALPVILASCVAFVLFLLLRRRNELFAFLAPLIYLFSFSILATSDYFTGMQLVLLLSLLGFLAYDYRRRFLSGILWGLAIMTKLYALPLFLGFLAVVWILYDFKSSLHIGLGSLCSIFLILLPFLVLSPKEMIDNVFLHHLSRPAGLDSFKVASYFFSREWFLLVFGTIGLFAGLKRFFWLPFLAGGLLIVAFQDIYYLYLDILLPFLVIGFIGLIGWFYQRKNFYFRLIPVSLLILVYVVFLINSLSFYYENTHKMGKFSNAEKVAEEISQLPENYPIYGSHQIAPLMGMLTEKKIFQNYIDTNIQSFSSGAQNLSKVSREAAQEGIYLLSRAIYLPSSNIKKHGFSGFFEKETFNKFCSLQKKIPLSTPEIHTHISIFKCAAD